MPALPALATPAGGDRTTRSGSRMLSFAMLGVVILLGLALRVAAWPYRTQDTGLYLIPWYDFARMHGWGALASPFTNYAPFYSYLLVIAASFDRFAPALLIIKSISFVFEFATSCLAYRLVSKTTAKPLNAGIAFAATWLAPTVLLNGAFWGQCDALWATFLVLCVYLFMTGRNGVLAYGAAFAVKAQGVFLGPFVLGMLMRERRSALWLLAVPLVYLVAAAPVLIAGRGLSSVASVYLEQGDTFHVLSANAASVWALVPYLPYRLGVLAGLAAAAAGGLWLAAVIARSARTDSGFILVAACASLIAMPFLLPKMHDRFFYAFEVMAIVLACGDRRYVLVAMAAQVSGLLSCAAFSEHVGLGVPIAAVQNAILLAFLISELRNPQTFLAPSPRILWAYGMLGVATCVLLPYCRGIGVIHPVVLAELGFMSAMLSVLAVALRRQGQRRLPAAALVPAVATS